MSNERGFVMVPAWLLLKKPTGNDVLVYCTLASHGTWNPGSGTYESCKPSIELMVDETGMSRSTVKRSLANLLTFGAVSRTLQYTSEGDPAPSLYRVIFGNLVEPKAVSKDETATERTDVGPPVNRPPTKSRKTRSRGGRSTCEPTSVQERTEGRSTGEPRVGPPVTHNQEPLNQEPLTQSSVPASQVRPDVTEPEQVCEGQITIDGDTEAPAKAREITDKDVANEIARVWIDYWSQKRRTPIGGAADHVLQAKMARSVLGFLGRGYAREEIGKALNLIGEPIIPTAERLQRALAAGRGVRPPTQTRERAGARVNGYWDDVRAAQDADKGAGINDSAPSATVQTTGAKW